MRLKERARINIEFSCRKYLSIVAVHMKCWKQHWIKCTYVWICVSNDVSIESNYKCPIQSSCRLFFFTRQHKWKICSVDMQSIFWFEGKNHLFFGICVFVHVWFAVVVVFHLFYLCFWFFFSFFFNPFSLRLAHWLSIIRTHFIGICHVALSLW